MALDDKDIKKISDSISEAISKGFDGVSDSLARIIAQQKSNIPNSALDYRGTNFGRRVTGEDLEQQLKRLTRDLQRQYADTRTATSGARVFNGITTPARELKYERDRVKDTVQSYKNAINELKETFGKLDKSDAEALKELNKEFDELTQKVKDSENIFGKLKDGVLSGITFTKEELEKVKELLENTDFTSIFDKNGKPVTDKVNELVDNLNKEIGKTVFDSGKIQSLANAQRELNKNESEREKIGKGISKVYEEQTESLKEQARYADLSIRTMKDGWSGLKRHVVSLAEGWRKVDQASANFAKNIGVGSRGLVALRKNTMDMIANKGIGLNYGIGMEDLINITQNYSKVTGRNVGMTAEDIETGAAMSRLMGDKGGEFATALENFGLSYTEAGKRAGKMFADASKAGLSFERYSDNFLKNIKMAQKYTFRDGLRGLERMAKKATEIRMDMQNIASFADKVSTLQGAAETSASLQVLGGPFAQFSDPLGMLNEGLNDMEGLMNRVDKMMNGISKFNTTTGQIDMNSFNRIRLREAAKAMNIPYEQLVETAQEKGRRNFVESQLNAGGRNFTDEQREFLLNTATVQEGQAKMSYLDKQGNRITKNVNELTAADIEQARAQNQSDSDNIKSIAKATMSLNERIEGVEKTAEAIKAKAIEPVMDWLKDKMGLAQDYLGAIKIAVLAIAGGQLVGDISKMVMGGGNFLSSGRFFRGMKAGVTHPGMKMKGMAGLGSKFANWGGKSVGVAGGVGNALGALATGVEVIAAGVDIFKKSKEIKGMSKAQDNAVGAGKYKKDSKEDIEATQAKYGAKGAAWGKGIGTAVGAATMLIPAVGPIISAIATPLLGKLGENLGEKWGKKSKKAQKDIAQRHEESIKEQRYNDALKRAGFGLNGGYTTTEYQQIMAAINRGGDNTITKEEFDSLPEELRNKLMASEDISLFPELQELTVKDATIDTENATINATSVNIVGDGKNKKANGGLLYGPSHAKGGVMVNAEGGEYVVNKEATKENLGLLSAINAKSYGKGGIVPRNSENMQPISVLPNTLTNNYYGGGSTSRIEPIDVNINGTIKLDGGNGKNIDMSSLLRDPVFIRQITNILEQEMILNQHGARYTNKLRS